MEHTNESILVKLADLVPSQFNVRRHSRTSVEELAALIDSQGLPHPLTVNEQLVGKGKSRKLGFAVRCRRITRLPASWCRRSAHARSAWPRTADASRCTRPTSSRPSRRS